MANPEQLEVAAKRIKEAVNKLRGVKGWNWSGLKGLLACAPYVVKETQEVGAELGLAGGEKKELAIDVILWIVPDAWAPDWVLRPILGWAIEKAVAVLKARFEKKPAPDAPPKAP